MEPQPSSSSEHTSGKSQQMSSEQQRTGTQAWTQDVQPSDAYATPAPSAPSPAAVPSSSSKPRPPAARLPWASSSNLHRPQSAPHPPPSVESAKLQEIPTDDGVKIEMGHFKPVPMWVGDQLDMFSHLPPVEKITKKIPKGVIEWLDPYGGPNYDPASADKTWIGAAVGLAFRGFMIALIIWNLVKLLSFVQVNTTGDPIVLNNNLASPSSGGRLDIPSIELDVSQSILFYEATAPSLQRIDAIDMTGYNPSYLSTTRKIPLARAFYENKAINLDSFDPKLSLVTPGEDVVEGDLAAALYDTATHGFDETLKVVYTNDHIFFDDLEFYNHSAVLFFRPRPEQMADLKMCQLQVALMNQGVYSALVAANVSNNRDPYHDPAYFKTLVTSDFTWHPASIDKNAAGGWRFADPDKSLVVLQSHFDEHTLKEFVAQQSYGPDTANISAVADLKSDFVRGGVHLDDFLNWKYTVSYVNNMIFTYENTSCDGDSFTFALDQSVADPIGPNDTVVKIYESDPFDGREPPFQVMLTSAVDNEEVTVIALNYSLSSQNLTYATIQRDPAIIEDLVWRAAPFECLASSFSEDTPAEWNCDESSYWGNDGCDCDCGAYDPDCCLTLDPPVKGCRNNEKCSLAGNCVAYQVESMTQMMVSEGCDTILYPGETDIAGFIGTTAQFRQFGQQCVACPDDKFFNGVAQLDPDASTFVCNSKTRGYVDGRENVALQGTETDTTRRIRVSVDNLSPFPTQGFPYNVLLSLQEGLQETVVVLNATMVTPNLQDFTVTTASGERPKNRHYSLGKIVSACNSDSYDVVVISHPRDPQPLNHTFPDQGPYSIRVLEDALTVVDASDRLNFPFQVMKLKDKPAVEKGYISVIVKAAVRGDTQLFVEPFPFWFEEQTKNITFPDRFPITVRGPPDTYLGIEIAHVVNYTDPSWRCLPSAYNAGDGCDCNCGSIDPDCLNPTPARYEGATRDSSVECVRDGNCQVCPFCTLDGHCTLTKSTNDSFIPTDPMVDFVMVLNLNSTLLLDHVVGYEVETPVTADNDPNFYDWYAEDNDYFDCTSYAPVELLDDDPMFKPADRWQEGRAPETSETADPLYADFALFTIPDLRPFPQAELCPSVETDSGIEPVFQGHGWEDWTVDPDRKMSVKNCRLSRFDDSECILSQDAEKNVFNQNCLKAMPPTHTFDFDQIMPFNNKWRFEDTDDGVPYNEPEFTVDVMNVFYFSHDNLFLAAENEFANNGPAGGDLERTGDVPRSFYGLLFLAGPGNGTTRTVPASAPYLSSRVVLKVNPDTAVQDALSFKAEGWPTNPVDVKALLDSFPALRVEWDLDALGGNAENQTVPLLPGYAYYLSAEVEVQPFYFRGLFGALSLQSWKTRVATRTFTKLKLDYFYRQQAQVRYTIKIIPTTVQIITAYDFDFKDFLDAYGAALALVATGIVVVSGAHKWLGIQQRVLDEEEKKNKLLERMIASFEAHEKARILRASQSNLHLAAQAESEQAGAANQAYASAVGAGSAPAGPVLRPNRASRSDYRPYLGTTGAQPMRGVEEGVELPGAQH